MSSIKLQTLIEALTCLPTVGTKSAQRMAIHLLQNDQPGGRQIKKALSDALDNIKNCKCCRNFSDDELCSICNSSTRNKSIICVVEGPMDVIAIEQSTGFKGVYFVLMGHLSPLDGVGPNEIGLNLLENHLQTGQIEELILATNITVEGDATAYYISKLAAKYNTKTSRIAYGVPMGGELEYIDKNTLGHAFAQRILI